MRGQHKLKGRCHCGNVSFVLHTKKTEDSFIPRSCQCTLCRSHGASWIADPEGIAEVTYRDKSSVSFYRFGLQIADFIICKNCGVLTVALCGIDGIIRGVFNVKSMLDHAFSSPKILPNFDGETVESRMERGKRNWTGRVTILD
jgi:hypothetical protein